jgi:hypothetical protein
MVGRDAEVPRSRTESDMAQKSTPDFHASPSMPLCHRIPVLTLLDGYLAAMGSWLVTEGAGAVSGGRNQQVRRFRVRSLQSKVAFAVPGDPSWVPESSRQTSVVTRSHEEER